MTTKSDHAPSAALAHCQELPVIKYEPRSDRALARAQATNLAAMGTVTGAAIGGVAGVLLANALVAAPGAAALGLCTGAGALAGALLAAHLIAKRSR